MWNAKFPTVIFYFIVKKTMNLHHPGSSVSGVMSLEELIIWIIKKLSLHIHITLFSYRTKSWYSSAFKLKGTTYVKKGTLQLLN